MSQDVSRNSARGEPSVEGALGEVLARLEHLEQQSDRLAPSAATELTAAIERLRAELAHEKLARDPSASGAAQREPSGLVLERLAAHAPRESRYRVEGEITRGGMGVILQAWDTDLRRTLAMKVALGRAEDAAPDPRTLARFVEEAQVTGQLDHPGIVPVHELGLDASGRVYFTMRLVRGRDLAEIFELARAGEDGWTQTRVLGVLLKVCEAMAYAHNKGVIHRDLKPANVMVGKFGEVYVMDWGLAKVSSSTDAHDLRPDAVDDRKTSKPARMNQRDEERIASETPLLTMDGTVLGTPAYMSPEQARGEVERMDARSDVYAVGAVLYQLLTGRVPYRGEQRELDARALWLRVLDGPPEPLRQVARGAPAELVAICERAMSRDVEARYPSMLALAEDLRAWLEGRVVRAYESGAWPELKKWVWRNKALAASSAAAVLAILVGALWTLHVEARSKTSLRLAADSYTPSYLNAEAASVWPAQRDAVERLYLWIEAAEDLLSREEVHRTQARNVDANDGTVQAERRGRLVAELERLREPTTGLLTQVRVRHAAAQRVRDASSASTEARAAWQVAIDSIADLGECPAYGGLRVVPQYGLLPLGKDAHSGLWEFAHLPSGDAPERDPRTGEFVLTERTGVVLVLLPGGAFWMGEQADDASAPNWVPHLSEPAVASPVHEITLDPFFVSKYEFTQAQWLAATGGNPSRWRTGFGFPDLPATPRVNALHPVEQISRVNSMAVVARLGLSLPTEAQWEYAARGGTTSAWWTGVERESLQERVNIADRSLATVGAARQQQIAADWPELDDGFPVHAPVDSFAPNPFGLFCVAGNVFEWCRDNFGEYDLPWQAGDGARAAPADADGLVRGGSFETTAESLRSAVRATASPGAEIYQFGLRAARALER